MDGGMGVGWGERRAEREGGSLSAPDFQGECLSEKNGVERQMGVFGLGVERWEMESGGFLARFDPSPSHKDSRICSANSKGVTGVWSSSSPTTQDVVGVFAQQYDTS